MQFDGFEAGRRRCRPIIDEAMSDERAINPVDAVINKEDPPEKRRIAVQRRARELLKNAVLGAIDTAAKASRSEDIRAYGLKVAEAWVRLMLADQLAAFPTIAEKKNAVLIEAANRLNVSQALVQPKFDRCWTFLREQLVAIATNPAARTAFADFLDLAARIRED
jgi:hypothetical protein